MNEIEMTTVPARRNAREIALHIIYERSFDVDNTEGILAGRLSEESFDALKEDIHVYENYLPAEECVYLRLLTSGVEAKRLELAEIIRANSKNWRLERISRISRAILEIALYEILYMDAIDTGVSINEAVELAKKYDTEEAASFINGVLGGYVRSSEE